ncbi:MAG: tetratricopeptide repeat protein [Anaerolineae bacterium]|nr:tetratricopeptide repeat protein [Anaerolineae bacterium]
MAVFGAICFLGLSTCTSQSATSKQQLVTAENHLAAGEYTAAATIYKKMLISTTTPIPALRLAGLYQTWGQPEIGLTALAEAERRGATQSEIDSLKLSLLVDAGLWNDAENTALVTLYDDPQNPQALATLTLSQLHKVECYLAAETATRWQAVAPENKDALKIRGILHSDALLLHKVSPEYTSILDSCSPLGSDLSNCMLPLGHNLLRESNWALAACTFKQVLQTDPTSPDAHTWLGEALRRLGYSDQAEEHLELATRLAPDSPLNWLLLGTTYIQKGKSEETEEVLFTAHQLDPYSPAPCLAIAELKAQQGKYNEVDIWNKAALERTPEDIDIWKTVARLYLERNLYQETTPDSVGQYAVMGAVALAPEDAETLMLQGWSRLYIDDMPGALFLLGKALVLRPDLAQAHYLQGLAYQATGEPEKAQDAFIRAADLGYAGP